MPLNAMELRELQWFVLRRVLEGTKEMNVLILETSERQTKKYHRNVMFDVLDLKKILHLAYDNTCYHICNQQVKYYENRELEKCNFF